MKEIEELAKCYWSLEGRTKRTVRDVKAYGTNLKEAAEDYLKDHNFDDFREEMRDMEDVKASLKAVNEELEVIRGRAQVIEEKSKEQVKEFEAQAEKALNHIYLTSNDVGIYRYSVVMCKALLSSIKEIIGFTAESYEKLHNQFSSIALQMGMIEKHLETITKALGEIETCLNSTQKAERQILKSNNHRKWTDKIIARADSLISACDKYFIIVSNPDISTVQQEHQGTRGVGNDALAAPLEYKPELKVTPAEPDASKRIVRERMLAELKKSIKERHIVEVTQPWTNVSTADEFLDNSS